MIQLIISKIKNKNHSYFLWSVFLNLVFLISSIQTVSAIDDLSIEIKNIQSNDWQLKGVVLSLSDVQQHPQKLVWSIEKLLLPEPFQQIKLLNIQCLSFSWNDEEIKCKKGKARFKSKMFGLSWFDLAFSVTENKSQFSFSNLKFAQGILSLKARQEKGLWTVSIDVKNLDLATIESYIPFGKKIVDQITQGQIDAKFKISGNSHDISHLTVASRIKNISLQANHGKWVAESANLALDLKAKLTKNGWRWENANSFHGGEIYLEPVYVELKKEGIKIESSGVWNRKDDIEIEKAIFVHPGYIDVRAQASIKLQPELIVSGNILTKIRNLQTFTAIYVHPFVEQSAFEGFEFKGQLESSIQLAASTIKQLSINWQNISVDDVKNRLSIDDLKGQLNWSSNSDFKKPSIISWKKLRVKAIPIQSGQLKLLFKNKNIQLLEQTKLVVLGGTLDINQFKWQQSLKDEPKVLFAGEIQKISLEQMSDALGWPSLTGEVSGVIPEVKYEDKTLTIDSELKVNLFDGAIKINKLASSGMFTDFAKFYMDMEIENMDLKAITQRFKMGGMEGRISGFINNLYLENWAPVTFYAWLGTPDNDDSRHRISQKAVENIASIGGGSAADVISKGFLRFFDTFSYDRLGFGCYLNQGVCQLMGVEAAEQGYYIIKGGGIPPRIDVIAHNPRVDWNILIERLSRIVISDDIVIN